MNPFIQSIGIFYKDKEWADDLISQFKNRCKDDLKFISDRKYEKEVSFKDGTFVRLIHISRICLCDKFRKVFVQCGIDADTFWSIISPKSLIMESYIIENYSDLFTYGRRHRANVYYNSKLYLDSIENNKK